MFYVNCGLIEIDMTCYNDYERRMKFIVYEIQRDDRIHHTQVMYQKILYNDIMLCKHHFIRS